MEVVTDGLFEIERTEIIPETGVMNSAPRKRGVVAFVWGDLGGAHLNKWHTGPATRGVGYGRGALWWRHHGGRRPGPQSVGAGWCAEDEAKPMRDRGG